MLEARIRKSFGSRPEAADFTLDVELTAGAGVSVLLGASGAGKTLTLDSIAGFLEPDEGRILLHDEILFDSKARVQLPPQRRRCGYVFQRYALFPHMTLRANLEFAVAHLGRLDQHRRVGEMIEKFRLGDVAGLRPRELSGGQKQRCSIARALVAEPRLLLLDEPSQGLDAALRTELYEVLRQVRAEFQTPVLLVTHDLEECFELGEEVFVMRSGRIIQRGTPRQLLARPASSMVAELLGQRNLLSAEIVALDPGRNTSRLRIDDFEMRGPYFPGFLIGDHLTVYVRPSDLKAWPKSASAAGALGEGNGGGPRLVGGGQKESAANQVPVTLERVIELPNFYRLEFSGGLTVEQAEEPAADSRDWLVSFPPGALRAIGGK